MAGAYSAPELQNKAHDEVLNLVSYRNVYVFASAYGILDIPFADFKRSVYGEL